MELYLKISYLNDFIFCPLSIYYHQLYGELSERMYYGSAQLDGKAAHSAIDEQRYSTHKNILQGMDIYSSEYNLCGKIDLFDTEKGLLTERKKHIETIYDETNTVPMLPDDLSLKKLSLIKDRNRYTPKNLKLPKIGMNEKDKYSVDYYEKYRYIDDMKKSMDFNKNTIKVKKV